ncbi:MAG TPA: Gfo/Idh/MocA family oxidoreductase [Fastidiosipila sp.]|nr:Gfo/Idh/MocA family oxidoreductase [Fastidiosipila sp.]
MQELKETSLTVAIVGLGNRGLDTYGKHLAEKEHVKISAVADPKRDRQALAAKLLNLWDDQIFCDAEALLQNTRLADLLIIATPDRQHVDQAVKALDLGYHLLMEKPISPDPAEVERLLKKAKETKRHVFICHVLRYTPFYNELKRLIDAGEIGEIKAIDANESVGYFHYAHSFVRGNWRNSSETSPMILQKCCHDFDIFCWLSGKKPVQVSSFGSQTYFIREHQPEGATDYCLAGCEAKNSCVFDAEKIYLTNQRTGLLAGNTRWPVDVVVSEPNETRLREALSDGPYGRCVFRSDNDVVDQQVVNMEFTDQMTVSFMMSAFTDQVSRHIHVMGTKGDIIGDFAAQKLVLRRFGKTPQEIDVTALASDLSGHGGGDAAMLEEIIDYLLQKEMTSARLTTLERSVDSHRIAFAAEKSRQSDGLVVTI